MIKAIIIDDEVHCIDTLSILLADCCPQVEVTDICLSGKQGMEAIAKSKPDVVFLDIEMPAMNGFELLENFKQIPFAVIFTTSYDQYAIKAIRFSALDYLMKPVDEEELVSAIRKISFQKTPASDEQFRMLIDKLHHKKNNLTKVAIPTAEGFELIPVEEIVYFEADDHYTRVFLKNKKKITACRTLKEMEEQLDDFASFLRVHNSYIVNLNEITRYIRGEGGYLVMSEGSTVNVSRSRKEALLNYF
jgi:two-component system LytT family response regulator